MSARQMNTSAGPYWSSLLYVLTFHTTPFNSLCYLEPNLVTVFSEKTDLPQP